MGVYYRLVNLKTNESIEPHRIGGGGVKWAAIVHGPVAKLFALLHMFENSKDWRIMGDDDNDVVDATEKYVETYNKFFDEADAIQITEPR